MIYEEIIKNLSKEDLDIIKDKTLHLGVFSEPYLTFMLEGKKTIESRFSKNKILPYQKITKDDIVFVKKSGGDVCAYFTIKEVQFFELNPTNYEAIKEEYGVSLCVDEAFWEEKKTASYATLIFIDKLVRIKPIHVTKKGMNTWLIIQQK